MKTIAFLITVFTNVHFAYGQDVPYPRLGVELLPQHQQREQKRQNIYERIPYVVFSGTAQDGKNRFIFVLPRDGCSSTPVTLSTTRNYFETWDNSFSGGSNSYDSSSSRGTYSYNQQGSSATAIANGSGAYANAQQGSLGGRGSYYNSETHTYRDWYNNRLRGQRQKNDSDTLTVFPCHEVQQ